LFVQILVACGFAASVLAASFILGKRAKASRAKNMPYECGLDPAGQANPRFSVKFYLVAMLFVLFDIEIVFLYPWAVCFKELGAEQWAALSAMFFFQVILGVGFLYEWKKGALDWTR